jgi:hypothetical protein
MSDVGVSREDFPAFVRPLLGLMVSLPWKGYGSAIFLELGQLAPLESPRQHFNQGESCISVEWDWRVEAGAASLYGSSNSGPTIERGIQSASSEVAVAARPSATPHTLTIHAAGIRTLTDDSGIDRLAVVRHLYR